MVRIAVVGKHQLFISPQRAGSRGQCSIITEDPNPPPSEVRRHAIPCCWGCPRRQEGAVTSHTSLFSPEPRANIHLVFWHANAGIESAPPLLLPSKSPHGSPSLPTPLTAVMHIPTGREEAQYPLRPSHSLSPCRCLSSWRALWGGTFGMWINLRPQRITCIAYCTLSSACSGSNGAEFGLPELHRSLQV